MKNFNIQLFAETPLNSTTTMTPEMKTFYEKRLIDMTVKLTASAAPLQLK